MFPNELQKRRSKRIPLEILVRIDAPTQEGRPLQGEGFTRAVNAHGGLLDAPFRMALGQHFTLINPASKKRVLCSVVQVGSPSSGFFPTAFEFLAGGPEFWPVVSMPSDWPREPDCSKIER
jgi:hypothetical protein